MYLKKLEIKGFKTFADTCALTFNRRISAIVGPNGSGKSNLTDAIRWVLGETSPRVLRQANINDVIFSGAQNRSPSGMANVSAIFAPTQDEEQTEKEVEICRRAYRDGESEFLINNSPKRLKDIQELFMGTGLGRGGIAILAEREVGLVLSPDPQMRKLLLEEFSGLSKFLGRKKEAQRKAQQAQENLTRLLDIKREVEVELKEAERQLAKLKRYLKGEKEHFEISRQLLLDEVKELLLKKKELIKLQGEHKKRLKALQASQGKDDTAANKLKEQLLKAEEEWGEVRAKHQEQLFLEGVVKRERENLEKKQERLKNELETQSRALKNRNEEIVQVKKQIELARAEYETENEKLKKSQETELKELQYKKGGLEQKIRGLQSAIKEAEKEIQNRKKEAEQTALEIKRTREQLDQEIKSREQLQELKKVEALKSAQDVIRLKEENPEISGILFEYIEVPENLKLPLEIALESRLYTLILKNGEIGTFLEKIKKANKTYNFWSFSTPPAGKSLYSSFPGVKGEVLKELKYKPEIAPLIESLLGGALLVDDLPSAQKVRQAIIEKGENPPLLLALSGEVINPQGIILGGKHFSTTMLSASDLKNKQLANLKPQNLEILKKNEEQLNRRIEEKQARIMFLEQKSSEFARQQENSEKIPQFNEELKAAGEELNRIEKILADEKRKQMQDKVKQLQYQLQKKLELETQLQKELALLKQKGENFQEELKDTEFGFQALALKSEKVKTELEKAAGQEKALRQKKEEISASWREIQSRDQAQRDKRESETRIGYQIEIELTSVNAHLEEKEKEAQQIGLVLNQVEWDSLEAIDRPVLLRAKERWNNFLRSFSGVNLGAEESFTRLKARFDELSLEIEDLEKAFLGLDKLINRLQAAAILTFSATFKQLNQEFSRIFPILFSGGEASLTLTDPANPLESGVNIIARPPGKRLQNISALSSGEKALTAIAFLFSLLQIKPCPFVLLDELDAPLDESNLEKVLLQLKEMAKISQFIIITHNRRTMEIAEQFYGVTMQEPGVSKLVGVRMQEVLPGEKK